MSDDKEDALVSFARHELQLILDRTDKDGKEMQQAMTDDVLAVVKIFASQGHSGFSASYALSVLRRLLDFKPLLPLTGEDDEWNEVGNGVFQNKRAFTVFKQADRFDGQAYDSNAVVFHDAGETACYSNSESSRPITFPYTVPHGPQIRERPAS